MKSKIIYVLLLLLVLLSVSAVSASDIANDTQEIQSVSEEVDLETADQDIQSDEVLGEDNSTVSSGSAGTFDDLQREIDSVTAGDTLKLYRDYNGAYGSRIQIVKSITIDGQGHTLDCKKEKGCSAFYINDGSVTLKNLIITNGNNDYEEYGGAIYSKTQYSLNVENCTFESNYAGCYGGAISSESLLNVNHCTFKFNHADRKGGAIYAKECFVQNSTFEMNYAAGSTFYSSDGGAIYTYGGNIVIYNSVFNENTAENYGGAIYTESALYINWYMPQTNVSTFFKDNIAQKDSGGAIYAQDIYIRNASFSSNFANDKGGAIFANGYSNIMDSKFEENSVPISSGCWGGAIWAQKLITVGGSTFISNAASLGGAIFAHASISLNEFNSFIKNSGTAVWAASINGEVKSQLFKENYGSTAALHISGTSDVKLAYCNFEGNIGINHMIFSLENSNMEVVSCSFEGNTLESSSGNLICTNSVKSSMSLVKNFFIDTNIHNNNVNGLCAYTKGTFSNISENVIRHCANGTGTNFYSGKDSNIKEQSQSVNVTVSYDPYGFKFNQSGFIYFNFTNPDGSPVIGLGVSKGGLQSEQDVEIKNSWITNNTLTVEIVPHQTGKIHITNAFDLDIDLVVEPVVNSSVKLKPFENVTFGNSFVVYFEVENRTAVYYTISDDTGIIRELAPPSLASYVNFTAPHAGNYKLTVYNVKGAKYLPSNASANFTVYKAKTELSLTVSNSIINNPVQGVINCKAAGKVNVTIDGVTRIIKHAGGLSTFTWNYLSLGEHEASAVLLENDNYYTETATSKFKVSNPDGLEFNIIANTTEISYGESIKLSVNITSDATGNITWKFINGTIINTTNLNESVILTNVHPGSQTVLAYYSGDGKYNSSSNLIVFVVNSLDNDVRIHAENITASDPVNITITGTVGGDYILIIDDFSRNVQFTNNSGNYYNETGLPVGDHIITVKYKGNRDYKSKTVSTILNVKKDQSSVKINEIANVTYGTPTTINFNVEHPVEVIMYIQDSDGKIIFEGPVNNPYSSVFNVGNYSVRIVNLGNETVNSSEAVSKFSVKKLPSSVKISEIGNVTYGEDTVIKFTVENPVNVNIYIADSDGNMVVNKAISGNYSDSLGAGNYTVKITNLGNDNVESSVDSANFSVYKADVNPIIYVPNMLIDASVSGYVYSSLNGNYTVTMGGKNITVAVSNNIGEFKVPSLAEGEYEAIVIYDGDENHNSASSSVKFNVTLKGTVLEIAANVTNITYGESIEVYVSNITQDVSGIISYYLSNGTFLGNKTAGENLTLSNLNAGTYVVIAKFPGDGVHNASVATLKITVNKAEVNVTVKTENVTYGNNSKLNITGIDGSYRIQVDDISLKCNVSGGSRTVDVGILPAGTHHVSIYYEGDENHGEATASSSFEVSKLTPTLTIETNDINYLEDAYVNITSDASGMFYVTIADQTKFVVLINGEKQSLVFKRLKGNESGWIVNVTCSGTENYTNITDTSAKIIVHKIDTVLKATVEEVYEGEGSVINFIYPSDIDGNVTVSVNGRNYSGEIDDMGTFTIFSLPAGTYTALINFTGNDCYNPASTTVNITVNAINLEASDMTRGYNSGMDYQVKLTNSTGPVSGKNITFTINGKEYVVTTDSKGIAELNIKLAPGTYNVLITNFNGETVSKTLNIVNRITENKNVKTYYAKNYQYKLRIIGDDGSAVGSGVAVKVTVNGKVQTLKTDKNGYITVKFTKKYVPKTYKVIAEYKGFKVSNKVKVKQILKLKKVKVKKSAKKLVLKATLKQGSKALKKKKVTFKFKGKKYKVKTNKKGIAKVTIKKSVLKKLKVGKKVKYQVTYLKDTVKRTVKVKR